MLDYLIRFKNESKCFKCGKTLDASRQTCLPEEGDISIYFYCGEVMVFDADLKLRQPPADDLAKIMLEMQIEQPEDYAAMQIFIEEVKTRRQKGH